jgi:hypothetical protein
VLEPAVALGNLAMAGTLRASLRILSACWKKMQARAALLTCGAAQSLKMMS